MRIAITNHHRQLVGGTESYLNGIIPALEQLGHAVTLFHEADVARGSACIRAGNHSTDFSTLRAFRPHVIFNHGLQSPVVETSLAALAPVVHFAHNYHGTCISGEKTHQFPSPEPCARTLGAGCLGHYFPHRCGGLNPLVMVREYQIQSARLGALRQATAIVTASQHMQAEYTRHGLAPVHRVPLFADSTFPAHTGGSGILFAGRMTRSKGAQFLAEAVRDLDTAITFAGDGPERADLERHCPRAAFPGWLPQSELRALAAQHDVFVMPSVWPEPFGLAGLESGLPVAAFASGGIPDWLTDGVNGRLAASLTAEALRCAIVDCLHNSAQFCTTARARTAEFTLERHLAALVPVLEGAAR